METEQGSSNTPARGGLAGGGPLARGRSQGDDLLSGKDQRRNHERSVQILCRDPSLETSHSECHPSLHRGREGKAEGPHLHGDSPRLRHADPAQSKVSLPRRQTGHRDSWASMSRAGQHSLHMRVAASLGGKGVSFPRCHLLRCIRVAHARVYAETFPGPAEAPSSDQRRN